MFTSRVTNLRKLISEEGLDAALISSTANIIYLTGFAAFSDQEREAFLLVTKKNQYIFTDGRYTESVKKNVKNFELLEISGKKSFTDHLKEIIQNEGVITAGIENNNITVAEHVKISSIFKKIKHFDLVKLRMRKDKFELEAIKEACKLGDRAFDFILDKVKPGISEKEIAFELEFFIRKNGAEISFPTIAAFEENAAVPHHHTGLKKLKNDELVLLDFGVKFENYCSDMTRTIFMGRASEEKKRAYKAVFNAQKKAEEFIQKHCHAEVVPGSSVNNKILNQAQDDKKIRASEVDRIARQEIVSNSYPSIPHSLGHGIGLEVHERPWLSVNSKDELENGMVFSIEPGIYLPAGRRGSPNKFGIRIEDLFAIENNKLIQLTNAPKNIIEL